MSTLWDFLCFHRTFSNLPEDLSTEMAQHLNLNVGKKEVSIDKAKQNFHANLVDNIRSSIPEINFKEYEVSWEDGGIQRDANEQHDEYLAKFVKDFIEQVTRIGDVRCAQWQVQNPLFPLYKEVLQHSRSLSVHGSYITEQSGIQNQIHGCLTSEVSRPIILHGMSGCGVSGLSSSLLANCQEYFKTEALEFIYREIGLTPSSKEVCELLCQISEQLNFIYDLDQTVHHGNISAIVRTFTGLLDLVSRCQSKPLLILLDGVDRLEARDRAWSFHWLPCVLPKNVFIIITLQSSSTKHLATLKSRIMSSDNFIEVMQVGATEAMSTVRLAVQQSWRTLTEDQWSFLRSITNEGCPAIILHSLVREALRWTSESAAERFPATVCEVVQMFLLEPLLGHFSSGLIQKALGYLALLEDGVSVLELMELLAMDEELLTETGHKYKVPMLQSSDSILRIVTSKLLHDIKPWLSEHIINSHRLLYFAHSPIRAAVLDHCFGQGLDDDSWQSTPLASQMFKRFGLLLSRDTEDLNDPRLTDVEKRNMDYISARRTSAINSRKLSLLPYLIQKSDPDWVSTLKVHFLFSFEWILVKLQGDRVLNLLKDIQSIPERDLELDVIQKLIELCSSGLKLDPETLPAQILGCIPSINVTEYPHITDILDNALHWIQRSTSPLVVPAFHCFSSVLDLCRQKFPGLSRILATDTYGSLAVGKSNDSTVDIWDLDNADCAFKLGIKFNKTAPNVAASDRKILALDATDSITIWDVNSGFVLHDLDLRKLLNQTLGTVMLMECSKDFQFAAFHLTDDDFNQSVLIVDTVTDKMIQHDSGFDLKDEFFLRSSSAFTVDDNGKNHFIFVNARSQVANDEEDTHDLIKLHFYSDLCCGEKSQRTTVNCGEKKFHQLMLKEALYAIVAWQDVTFDLYWVETGSHAWHLSHPANNLKVQESLLTKDGLLLALYSTSKESQTLRYGLFFWDLPGQTPVELINQEVEREEEIPKQLLVLDEVCVAVLASAADVALWDLVSGDCLRRVPADGLHLDGLLKAPDPFQLFLSCGPSGCVERWDIYPVLAQSSVMYPENPNRASRSQNWTDISPESILKRQELIRSLTSLVGSTQKKSVRFADAEDPDDPESPKNEVMPLTETQSDPGKPDTIDQTLQDGVQVPHYHNIANFNDTNGSGKDMGCFWNRDPRHMDVLRKAAVGVTSSVMTGDSAYLIVTTVYSPPVMWDLKADAPCVHYKKQAEDDRATVCCHLVVDEQLVLGLTTFGEMSENQPEILKLQVCVAIEWSH